MQIHRELEVDAKMVTADAIRDRYYGRDKVQHTLLEIYTDHNEKCRALIGKEYTESTVTKFETSINRLREFIRFGYHKDDLFLNELDGQFIRDFEYWLKTSIGCQNNSALKHLKNLKKSHTHRICQRMDRKKTRFMASISRWMKSMWSFIPRRTGQADGKGF